MGQRSAIAPPTTTMTVDEFLTWSKTSPGRYELHDGSVQAMPSERAVHADVKFTVQAALKASIAAAGLPCRMLPDGMTVRIDKITAYEPDALVYCGERLLPDAIEVANPVNIVEVTSPSTADIDNSSEPVGYFSLPSVMHYLIVHPKQLPVIHHAQQADGTILTRLVGQGALTMSPPGMAISVDDLLD
jgi:Uma2 family endonuclease